MWQPDMNSLDQLSQILSQATMADNKTQNEIYKVACVSIYPLLKPIFASRLDH